MPKNHVIDYETFLRRLVEGLRKTWEAARRERPDETFYLFGITTDSDITDLRPFWNTEEQYAEQESEHPIEKWAVPEETYETPRPDTADLADEVNRYVFEDHSHDPENAFAERKARLLDIFEKALVQLDREGLFGKGKERHRLMLMLDFSDPSHDENAHAREVIRRINPPESTAPFFKLLAELTDSDRQDAIEAAKEFLREQKQPFTSCTYADRLSDDEITAALTKSLGLKQKPTRVYRVAFHLGDEAIVTIIRRGKSEMKSIIVLADPASGNFAIET